MGRFNNDTKRIVLKLLLKHNIVRVCEQYQSYIHIYCDHSFIGIYDKLYNWRDLQNRSCEGWAIWGKQHRCVCKIPKNY